MRILAVSGNFSVMRSPLPGSPIDTKTGKQVDVPVAIFGGHSDIQGMVMVAEQIHDEIIKETVWYEPPEEIIFDQHYG